MLIFPDNDFLWLWTPLLLSPPEWPWPFVRMSLWFTVVAGVGGGGAGLVMVAVRSLSLDDDTLLVRDLLFGLPRVGFEIVWWRLELVIVCAETTAR